jgi:hypothetical protein
MQVIVSVQFININETTQRKKIYFLKRKKAY